MSYCRFSSDNWKSHAYVYEDVSGSFVTMVAAFKRVADTPIPELPANWWTLPPDEMVAAVDAQHAWLEKAKRVPIGLPFDGEHFNDGSAADCAQRLRDLKAAGYNIPQHAIDALAEEAAHALAVAG